MQDSGTTATVSFICGADVVTANVGDSLAFVDCGSEVHQLSGNHRIDENAAERKRLEAAGGDIASSEVDGHPCGPLRIWPGGLAMSRYLADAKVSPQGAWPVHFAVRNALIYV